jgi:UDP-N-acetylglucosamine acyltransferase
MSIAATAVISPSATLGANVTVGAYAVIGDNVSIGDGCVIDSHVVISGPTRMGSNNRLYPFASVGSDPQDLKFKGEETFLEIGDNNIFRESVTVNRGTGLGGGVTKIGSHNLFMAYVHIAHDCIVGNHCIFANNTTLAGHILIQDYVTLGGSTKIAQFLEIGAHVFSHGGSIITRNTPPFVAVSGAPCKPSGINSVGLQRTGYDAEQISVIRKAYKQFFRSDDNLAERVVALQQLEDPVLEPFIDFVQRKTGNKFGLLR